MLTFQQFAEAHGVLIRKLVSGDRIWRCPTTTQPPEHERRLSVGRLAGGDGMGRRRRMALVADDNAKPWICRKARM